MPISPQRQVAIATEITEAVAASVEQYVANRHLINGDCKRELYAVVGKALIYESTAIVASAIGLPPTATMAASGMCLGELERLAQEKHAFEAAAMPELVMRPPVNNVEPNSDSPPPTPPGDP